MWSQPGVTKKLSLAIGDVMDERGVRAVAPSGLKPAVWFLLHRAASGPRQAVGFFASMPIEVVWCQHKLRHGHKELD